MSVMYPDGLKYFQLNEKEMKHVVFLALALGTLASCREVEEDLSGEIGNDQFSQKWTLVEMTGSVAGDAPATGNDMAWQEYYILNEDSTFTKHREQDGEVSEASGVFTFVTTAEESYIELTYPSDNQLIGSCYSQLMVESLLVVSETELKGTWQACDGPGLTYERTDL